MNSSPSAVWVLAILLATTQSLSAYVPCQDEPRMATEFGVHVTLGENLQPSIAPVELPLESDIRWIRVLLKSVVAPSFWKLTIRDGQDRPLQTISSNQLDVDRPWWTDRLPTNALYFFLEATDASTTVRLMEYTAMSSEAKKPYYSIQSDTPQWIDLFKSNDVDAFHRRKGDGVGMFVTHSGTNLNGFKVWSCTGFVVANKPRVLFVTNDHCGGPWDSTDRWAAGICENALVDFSWDGDPVSREYSCKQVRRDPANDLAVLELVSSRNEAPPNALALRGSALNAEPISIIHHPASLSKQISHKCNGMTGTAEAAGTIDPSRDFAHSCDTEGGSSGAPVLDDHGLVVGVHHLGFQKNLAGACDRLNKAIHARHLIALLQSLSESGYTVEP